MIANPKGSTIEQNLKDTSSGEFQPKHCGFFLAKHGGIGGLPEMAEFCRETAESRLV